MVDVWNLLNLRFKAKLEVIRTTGFYSSVNLLYFFPPFILLFEWIVLLCTRKAAGGCFALAEVVGN